MRSRASVDVCAAGHAWVWRGGGRDGFQGRRAPAHSSPAGSPCSPSNPRGRWRSRAAPPTDQLVAEIAGDDVDEPKIYKSAPKLSERPKRPPK